MNLAKAILRSTQFELDTPPSIGSVYGGGYYAGKIKVGSAIFGLIVSPKATGEGTLVYRTSGAAFTGNTSTNDGWLIRANMIAAGISDFPAQAACISLTIGGFNDWYIGAKDEMEVIYRAFKPTTTSNSTSSGVNSNAVPTTTAYTTTVPARSALAIFETGGAQTFAPDAYFSATQGPSGSLYAHGKLFSNGSDAEDLSTTAHIVRAIRRVPMAS